MILSWLLISTFFIQNLFYQHTPQTPDIQTGIVTIKSDSDIIIDGYIQRVSSIKHITYARGCAGSATKCRRKNFDCSWLIKYFGYKLNIFSKKEIAYYSSSSLFALWKQKPIKEAKRWDFTFRLWQWKSWERISNHIAVVTRPYSWGWLWIIDNINNQAKERFIKLSCSYRSCTYIGKRKITLSSNWLLEETKRNNIVLNTWNITLD